MRHLLFLSMLTIIVSCGTKPIVYQANKIPYEAATVIIDRMIMTQHQDWKPDHFAMTENYFNWDYGISSQSNLLGSSNNNSIFAQENSTKRNVNERIYYDSIADVRLLDWTRKLKQWYVVTLYDKNDVEIKHMLRTREIEDAKLMVDALVSFLSKKNNADQSTQ